MPGNRPIPFDQFRQRVRRHRPTDVLAAVAGLSAELVNEGFRVGDRSGTPKAVQHFSLAAVARAAILYGNEHREPGVGRYDLAAMCDYYLNVEDPALAQEPGLDRIRLMLSRILYDQALFGISEMENVGRTVALLLDHAEGCDGALSAEDWRSLLGVTLEEFMRIGFAMHVAAIRNGGQISRQLLTADHVAPIFTPLTADAALEVVDSLYAATIADLQAMGRDAEVATLEKHSFNPLLAKPIVAIGDRYVMPIPRYIIERFSPAGLYFIALAKYGSRFTNALGCMFERYVGTQLAQIERWMVHAEIVYGANGEKTVDFFIVTDTCVVLVEVKAARPIEATRTGGERSDDDIQSKVGHAIEQVNRSADLIKHHDALSHLNPNNLPVLGLVVTLEPFLLVNTLLYEGVLTAPEVPTIVASAHELEDFIARLIDEPDPDKYVAAAYKSSEGEPKSLPKAIENLDRKPNPILIEAWGRFMKPIDDLKKAGVLDNEA